MKQSPRTGKHPAQGAQRSAAPAAGEAAGTGTPAHLRRAQRPGAPPPARDAQEQAADASARTALRGGGAWQDVAARLGVDPASVKLHAGPRAAVQAGALRARAYTAGSDIVFGAGQLAPHTPGGAALLAHELAHVAQQRQAGVERVQCQSADVTIPEETITGALRPISGGVRDLDSLTTPLGADEIGTDRSDPDAPDSTERLPFTSGGWEAGTILTRLGQFDDMAGTDSDANRCVQAVALSSYIIEGPAAVRQYISALLVQAATRPRGARENKAREVLEYFQARIDNRLATYGDVSWAQEAMHDLFYADRTGTPEGDVPGLMANALGPDREFQALDVWCETPLAVVEQAKRLEPGQQLLAMPVIVTFNQALDEAGSDTRGAANETDVVMEDGRQVHVTRFDASTRPPSSAINRARDKVSGHQILIVRDAVTAEIRVYEPEITGGSDHFMELDEQGRNFESAFRDSPQFQIYGYVQILGRVKPRTPPPRMFAQYQPSWL